MIKLKLVLLLLISFQVKAQQTLVDSLLEKMDRYQNDSCRVDQLISTGNKIIELDRKVARRSRVYYHLSIAYFAIGEFENALKTARIETPIITFPQSSRIAMQRNRDSRIICYKRYEYYAKVGEYSRASKNLALMLRKYKAEYCGVGREERNIQLRQRMIDCLEESGKCRKAVRLRNKVYI